MNLAKLYPCSSKGVHTGGARTSEDEIWQPVDMDDLPGMGRQDPDWRGFIGFISGSHSKDKAAI